MANGPPFGPMALEYWFYWFFVFFGFLTYLQWKENQYFTRKTNYLFKKTNNLIRKTNSLPRNTNNLLGKPIFYKESQYCNKENSISFWPDAPFGPMALEYWFHCFFIIFWVFLTCLQREGFYSVKSHVST